MDNTLIGWLVWLGSAAGVALVGATLSRLLERTKWFQQISPNGKQAVVIGGAVVIAVAGKAAAEYLAANPDLTAMVEPYAQTVMAVLGYLGAQAAHGMAKESEQRKAQERKAYVRMVRAAVDDGAVG